MQACIARATTASMSSRSKLKIACSVVPLGEQTFARNCAGDSPVCSTMRAAPMAPYFAEELYPGDQVQSDEALTEIIRERATTSFHLMGSCRMGPEGDATAVVDHKLRVRGMDGLRVADASIMPTMPAANTNAASLMIGEKAADLIRGD